MDFPTYPIPSTPQPRSDDPSGVYPGNSPRGRGVVYWFVAILLIQVVLFLLFLALVLWTFRAVVLPVLVLFSPWQPSVAIELADGTRLVYRDLSDAEEFVSRVAQRIPEPA